MYSTPLVEAVSLCRKDFRISWEGGGRRRGERRKSCLLVNTCSLVQGILGYCYEFYSRDFILSTGQDKIRNISS